MSFFENFERRCDERGMSVNEFLMKNGFSRSNRTEWSEHGRYPRIPQLLRICELLDTTPNMLLLGKEALPDNFLVQKYDLLNADGQQALRAYMDYLLSKDEYRKESKE